MILKFYEKSDDLEMWVSVGMCHHGFEEMYKAYEVDSKGIVYYDSTIKNVQVHISTTSTLRKVDSNWYIVLEHSSLIRGIERAVRIEGE